MKHPTIIDVQRAVRARICQTCPYRSPGTDHLPSDLARPCEAGCRLFAALPLLCEVARHADPMVGRRTHRLRQIVHWVTPRGGALRRNGRGVVQTIEKLVND